MSLEKEFDELQRYRELFKKHFGLQFDYGWVGPRDGSCKYITLSKTGSSYDITFVEAYGDSFAACLQTLQKKLCTYGLIPDTNNIGLFPLFSSPRELEMKLDLMGK